MMTPAAAGRKLARLQRHIERALYAIAKTPLRVTEDQSTLLQAWAKLEVARVNLLAAPKPPRAHADIAWG